MGFVSVDGWQSGDRLVDFRGEEHTLQYITRGNTENKSAKVLVDGGEYYADCFTNVSLSARQ